MLFTYFLPAGPWLGPPARGAVGAARVGTQSLHPVSGGRFSAVRRKKDVSLGLVSCGLYYTEDVPSLPSRLRVFTTNGCGCFFCIC